MTFHEQLVARHAPLRKLRRYQLCDERIQRIVQSYANYGIMDYLRGLAQFRDELSRLDNNSFHLGHL